jgi:prevent-host-death family protein
MLVNVHDAKTNLSKLLQQVEAGEEIVIGRNGVPVARLVKVDPPRRRRQGGAWTGKVWISPDIDELDAEIERSFNESVIFPEDD